MSRKNKKKKKLSPKKRARVKAPVSPSHSSNADAQVKAALKYHQAGQTDQAGPMYEQVLKAHPDHADALHLLGVIAYQKAEYGRSESLIRRAIDQNSEIAFYHSNLGNSLKKLGQTDEAETCYRKALALNPQYAEAWYNLGSVLKDQGKADEAIICFRKSLEIKPDYHEAYSNMANALKALGKTDEALACFRNALAVSPEYSEAYCNMGNLLKDLGRLDEAIDAYKKALEIRPDYPEVCNNMGNAYKDIGRFELAVRSYHKAITLRPGYTQALNNLGNILNDQGHLDRAITYYRKALAVDPSCEWSVAGEAKVLMKQGDFEGAYQRILPFIRSGTDNYDIAVTYAQLADRFDHYREAIAHLKQIVLKHADNVDLQRQLHFNLGRLYDKLKEYDAAFGHFFQANELRPKRFDVRAHENGVSALISAYSPGFQHRLPRAVNRSEIPVFIVGMPRSGTSLVEQIVASHPQVHGAGELSDIAYMVRDFSKLLKTSDPYPKSLGLLTERMADILAQNHLRRLRRLSRTADRITDKMPQNFFHLGLLSLMFPKARVIHCVRNPLDTALSVYFQNFSGGLTYSFDMKAIAVYYQQYRRMMAHWKSVLDIPILDVRYEALIEDQERLSREMIDFLGLAWDDRCLTFHKTRRSVSTASFQQVREPIYRGSMERWRNYEKHIGPLIEAIGAEGEE
ncbi:hypothetical protein DENIS_2648 [Desulfonema ishimotonii]|uniref:Uncharacterized protein n=1 Tax=Desulfonema ishimotonii TaxID=45657 RepID=A0A401FXL0_9BACT|nr:tetratricopeptide repeat protein [Desulfonema ishimotonii]GBC61686.1 hypothetical protein DENIS_2648 [Desulfonema ishimotonii]